MFVLIETLHLHIITGILATIIFLAGLRGLFVHVLHPERREAYHLVMVLVLVISSAVLRTVNWDLARVILPDDLVDQWRLATRGLAFNAILNGLMIWGGYHLHKLIWLILPIGSQTRYTVWSAWLYPLQLAASWPGRKLEVICKSLRRRK